MTQKTPASQTGFPAPSQTPNSAMIDGLQAAPAIQSLSYLGLKTVAATRLLAICSRTGKDPLLELIQRFGSVSAARAFIHFADLVGAYWPEPVQVMRPCCRMISPDEWTMGLLADHAAKADRAGFCAAIDGFVRQGRHDALYDATVAMIAHMQ